MSPSKQSSVNMTGSVNHSVHFVHLLYDMAQLMCAFLGAFEKLRKATIINFIMSVSLPISLRETTHLDGFS
jgi:hypothetical protein